MLSARPDQSANVGPQQQQLAATAGFSLVDSTSSDTTYSSRNSDSWGSSPSSSSSLAFPQPQESGLASSFHRIHATPPPPPPDHPLAALHPLSNWINHAVAQVQTPQQHHRAQMQSQQQPQQAQSPQQPPQQSPQKPPQQQVAFRESGKDGAGGGGRGGDGKGGPTVLTFALKHRPRATRASVPKVRTGCKTCKKRHVKCDEVKPSCQRCLKWQGFCDGYDDAPPQQQSPPSDVPLTPADVSSHSFKSKPAAAAHQRVQRRQRAQRPASIDLSSARPSRDSQRLIAFTSSQHGVSSSTPGTESKPGSETALQFQDDGLRGTHDETYDDTTMLPWSASTHRDTQELMLLEPNYNSAMFVCQWEKVYFDRWLMLAPDLGGGWFLSKLWTRTIPQLCRDVPAVRYAAIAVGALARARNPGHVPDAGSQAVARSGPSRGHYRNALMYYSQAMRLLRMQGKTKQRLLGPSLNLGLEDTEAGLKRADKAMVVRTDSDEELRTAAVACLLFVCFEAIHGYSEAARGHIKHGLQIVDQFVARNMSSAAARPDGGDGGDARVGDDNKSDEGDVGNENTSTTTCNDINNTMWLCCGTLKMDKTRTTATRLALARQPTRSPAPYVLDDEVMQVFRRLDFQLWSMSVFRVRRSVPSDFRYQALDVFNPSMLPAVFENLEDARCWWDLTQQWVLQFPRSLADRLQRYMQTHPEEVERAAAENRMMDMCDVPGARDMQRVYLACLESWHAAFWPLYDAARCRGVTETDGRDRTTTTTVYGEASRASSNVHEAAYLRATSLEIQYLLVWVCVWSLSYSDYEAMYQLTPKFRELNRLAGILLPRQPHYNGYDGTSASTGSDSRRSSESGSRNDLFTLDNGPTMALFVVATKCRVEEVRSEAIRLLAAYPRRDGIWDSKVLGILSEWNRKIEADNDTEGTLCERWRRLRQREAVFDDGRVEVTAFLKHPVTGKLTKMSQVLQVDRGLGMDLMSAI